MQKFIGFDVRHRKCREKCPLRAVQEILQGFPGVHQEVQVILEGVLRIIEGILVQVLVAPPEIPTSKMGYQLSLMEIHDT